MPRKPNYDFERRERERLKKLQKAARADAKVKPAKEGATGAPDQSPNDDDTAEI